MCLPFAWGDGTNGSRRNPLEYRGIRSCFVLFTLASVSRTCPSCFKLNLLLVLVSLILSALVGRASGEGLILSEHIRHFEPVFYSREHLREQHRRAKRDATSGLSLRFHSHGRLFQLRLKRDTSIFSDEVIFEKTGGHIDFDLSKVMSGTLEDDELATVSGVVTNDGLFDGHIDTVNDIYYLEPASRYLEGTEFHSVMYKASDVVHPPRSPPCASSQRLHLKGFARTPRDEGGRLFEPNGPPVVEGGLPLNLSSSTSSALDPPDAEGGPGVSFNPKMKAVNRTLESAAASASFRLYYASTTPRPPATPRPRARKRLKRSPVDPAKTTCMLYLQADHLFYQKVGSEEACIESITRHVQRVNSIYKATDFDLDGLPDSIGFMIKRVKVHTQDALNDQTYRFPGNYGVEKFLEIFSEEDYDAFCLAYMFTYRDFEGGTLGLAWTGDLKNAGGVCEKNGHYRGSLKSLNTGIVTLLNYGKHVPPAVSHVTLAHEIGHNFGSPHDPEKDTYCTPGGEDGNYIMFARATSGDKRNNNKFSPCSLKQINSVLNSKARDAKGCFTEPQKSICGNGVVEPGEECDCGWEEDCNDKCCFPMTSTVRRGEKPCALRPNKICSPSQGPCCTSDCQLEEGTKCRDDNGCRDVAFCNGMGPQCPPSINKPNKTVCNEEFVCFKGECTGSICLAYGLDSCQCIPGPGDPETKACELCCKLPGENQPCLSSFKWNTYPTNIPDLYAKPGTPCNNYKGYCDVFRKCREVDPSGPLATLRKILLSDESLANLQRWVLEYWYAVFVVVLAIIILLAATIRLFGKNAETFTTRRSRKKKKKTIIHKNQLPTTSQYGLHPPEGELVNHVIHPTVVRSHIPFKRRVNEVTRVASKAKRAAKSQLGKQGQKRGTAKRPADKGAMSPTDSERSGPNLDGGTSPKGKDRPSSRWSIISFRTFRSKSVSPSKHKAAKGPEKARLRGGSASDKQGRSKGAAGRHRKSRSQERAAAKARGDVGDRSRRPQSPTKRPPPPPNQEDERRRSRRRSYSPEKARKQTSPEKSLKPRTRSPEKLRKLSEGNWLINKFLADEEKTMKPPVDGSVTGSMRSSINSFSATPLHLANGSPLLDPTRHGSTKGLLAEMNRASPIKGIVNEAFVSSPKIRTHSSLRVTKSVSPEGPCSDLRSNNYRRSISMETYSRAYSANPDKRKRATLDEGLNFDKKRRFSSPEKPVRTASLRTGTGCRVASPELPVQFSEHLDPRRRHSSISALFPGPKVKSFPSVQERVREKLSLITACPNGSVSYVLPDDEAPDSSGLHLNHSGHQLEPKEWV